MLELFLFYIPICCACFGIVWIHELTSLSKPDALLWWLPNYYPKILDKVLRCEVCISGWATIICVTVSSAIWIITTKQFKYELLLFLPSCFNAMTLCSILKKFYPK